MTVRAVEGLGDIPPVPAVINFHEPGDIFEEAILEQAMTTDRAHAAVYAQIDFGEEVWLDESGDRLDGQTVHRMRYRSGRSRFILGLDADANHPVPDTVGLGLLQHCYTEFGYLAKVLPSLYWADRVNRADVPVCGTAGDPKQKQAPQGACLNVRSEAAYAACFFSP